MSRTRSAGKLIPGLLSVALFASSQQIVEPAGAQAIPGRPFGVGGITVPVSEADALEFFETGGYAITERDHRVHYPVFITQGLLQRIGSLVDGDVSQPPNEVTVLFLFQGTAPLDITVNTPHPRNVTLTPQPEPSRVYRRLFNRWWRGLHTSAREQARVGDHPPLVHTYLTSMLTPRLDRSEPLLGRAPTSESTEVQQTLELLLGVEKLRDATMRRTLRGGPSLMERDEFPLPEDALWTPRVIETSDTAVDIEPIAMHTPEECFYIRFGTFANYLWFSKLAREYSGDLATMITLRGHAPELNERMQTQLALRESALAELFGGQVTADVAIIGRDLFLREGAAVGILFQARNNFALSSDLTRQRTEALAKGKENGATLETVKIGDRDVSFLSTPDNRLRSFYAVDGDFHFVTTSRALVARFYAAGAGDGSLAASAEFRHARTVLPTERKDTMFAYFSSAFFRGLLSPQYQIELSRRLEAVTDIELVQLARLAARAERVPGRTIEELVAARLLPQGFGRHADGSGPILETDRVIDSLRGARGSFLPIPDVRLRGASRREVVEYSERARYYAANWRQLDPLMVGVQRQSLDQHRERVVIDANVSPLGEEKYGWVLSLLGPATSQHVVPGPRDVISVQGFITGGMLSPIIPPHHLYVGVVDSALQLRELPPRSFLQYLGLLQTTPGYLGAWPKPGFLDLLPVPLSGEVDANGFSRLPLGLWRWQGGGFSVLSFRKEVLEQTAPELRIAPAETAAQLRLQIDDLSQSELAEWINLLFYQRARQASLGNVRLMHTVSNQLGVPRAASLETANQLLDSRLVCAVGGDYEFVDEEDGVGRWRSTRWPAAGETMPDDYQAPLLKWFRGLDLEVTKLGDRLVMHAELELQRHPTGGTLKLPFLDILGGKKKPPETESSP